MSSSLIDLEQEITQIVIKAPYQGATLEGIKIGSTKAEVHGVFAIPDKVTSSGEQYDFLNTHFSYSSRDSTVIRIDMFK